MYDQDNDNVMTLTEQFLTGLAQYMFVYGELRLAGLPPSHALQMTESTFPSHVLECPSFDEPF